MARERQIKINWDEEENIKKFFPSYVEYTVVYTDSG